MSYGDLTHGSGSIIQEYRENNESEAENLSRLQDNLPESTFLRVESLVEENDSIQEIVESGELSDLSKIELKYLVGCYLGEPTEYILDSGSLREQYIHLIENLYQRYGGVEL
jgi:hypothetical protein